MAQPVDSGTTGSCSWELTGTTDNYTLTISGTGAMGDYSYLNAPWYSYRDDIKTLDIQQGVTTIGISAFYNCSGLTSVTIPNSVTSIESYAFSYCSGLTSATIPNSVTTIRYAAFTYCTGLKSMTIPNSVTTIETYAFRNCTGLTSITNLSLTPQNINSSVFYGVDKSSCTLTVPTSAMDDYAGATEWGSFEPIGGGALLRTKVNYPALGNVTVNPSDGLYPENTLVMLTATPVSSSFLGWTSGEINLGYANSLQIAVTQDTVITANFGNIGSIDLPVAGTLKVQPNIKNITHLSITGNIDARDIQFMRDSIPYLIGLDLTNATIVEYSGTEGTNYGGGINRTYLADEMPMYSFFNSNTGATKTTLASVKLPAGLTTIGYYAFWNCTGLTSVTIPNSATNIGVAFYGCSNLAEIYVKAANPPSVITGAFNGVPNTIPVHVPCDKTIAYQNWGGFSNFKADILAFDITLRSSDITKGSAGVTQNCTDNAATITATPNLGYHFVQWNDGDKSNPRTITLTQDMDFTAEFAVDIHPSPDGIVYVKKGGSGAKDGSSWENAYPDLALPLKYSLTHNSTAGVSDSIKQIWVARGKYYPMYKVGDGIQEQYRAFVLVAGVKVYGGFPNTGDPAFTDRDYNTYITVLSGDICNEVVGDGNDSDSVYNVVIGAGEMTTGNDTARLDGFTVTGGIAGGIYNSLSSPVIANVIVTGNSTDNSGGGICNRESSPVLTNVDIRENSAREFGGGIYNWKSSPVMTNVDIRENKASEGGGICNESYSSPVMTNVAIYGNSAYGTGGGIYNLEYSSPVLTDVLISGNSADGGGGMMNDEYSSPRLFNVVISSNFANFAGGMANSDNSSPELFNVTISGNKANQGGGVYNVANSSPEFTNSVIWGNRAKTNDGNNVLNEDSQPVYAYSLIEGSGGNWGDFGIDKGNNIDADPLFIAWTDPFEDGWENNINDYRLNVGSPAINAGNDAAYLSALGIIDFSSEKDFLKDPRKVGVSIDMGAYENQTVPRIKIESHPANITVTAGDISGALSVMASVDPVVPLGYQWYQSVTATNTGGAIITGATGASFNIPAGSAGLGEEKYYYYVTVSAINAGTVTSNVATVTVIKNTQPAPGAPVDSLITATSIILKRIAGAEYRINNEEWTDNPVFDSLVSGISYSFWARMKATETQYESPASLPVTIATLAPPSLATPTASDFEFSPSVATYDGSEKSVTVSTRAGITGMGDIIAVKYNGRETPPAVPGVYPITVDVSEGTDYWSITSLDIGNFTIGKGTLIAGILQFSPASATYDGSAKSVTVTARDGISDIGNVSIKYNGSATPPAVPGVYSITVDITGGINYTDTTDLSLGDFTINKATQSAPELTFKSKTATSITLETIEGAKYRIGNREWQDGATFDNLEPYTQYTFYAMMAETDTHEASPESEALPATTYDAKAGLLGLSVYGTSFTIADTMKYMSKCGDEHPVRLNIETTLTASTTVAATVIPMRTDYVDNGSVDRYSIAVVVNGTQAEDLNNIPVYGDVMVKIHIVAEDKVKDATYVLMIYGTLEANDVLYQRWNDVLAVNRNSANNGGYGNIAGVRWYRNDVEESPGKWFIQLSEKIEHYRIEINLGGKLHNVCGSPEIHTLEKVLAYPNPVSAGDNLNLHLPAQFAGGYMDVISIAGATVKRKLPLPAIKNIINVPDLPPGIYLLHTVSPDGYSETTKIVVN